MSNGVPAVTTCEIGLASGILGAGVGYVLAPRKYNLEQLLVINQDEFEKSIRTNFIKSTDSESKRAYSSIVSARKRLTQAFNTNKGEAKLVEYTKNPKLIGSYESIKKFIPHARVQSAIFIGVLSAVGATFTRILSKKPEVNEF